eukprot:4404810-Alexandrium_andersonii.AAC.1
MEELLLLPDAALDRLAGLLLEVERSGVWPQGLLHWRVAFIPKESARVCVMSRRCARSPSALSFTAFGPRFGSARVIRGLLAGFPTGKGAGRGFSALLACSESSRQPRL